MSQQQGASLLWPISWLFSDLYADFDPIPCLTGYELTMYKLTTDFTDPHPQFARAMNFSTRNSLRKLFVDDN